MDNELINNDSKNKYACQERWQKKAGYISKAYKLKKEVADEFALACQKANVSQAAQITKMMNEFIKKILNNQ